MVALSTGASGLSAYGEAMSVTGSNIANINTVGYKSSRVSFQDLLATGVRGTTSKIGRGVSISSVQSDFSQGSLEATSRITDMAIEGSGFFQTKNQFGRVAYTRAGNFEFDKEGFLVSAGGDRIQVRKVDEATGDAAGFPTAAKVLGLQSPPKATGDGSGDSGITVAANLNADSPVPEVQFDPTNVQSDMFNYSTSTTVIDERGGEHVVTMAFVKMPDAPPQIDAATGQPIPGTAVKNQWQFYTVVNGTEVGGPPENQIAIGGGFVNFTEDGRMLEATNGTFVQPVGGEVGPDGQIIPPGPPVLIQSPTQLEGIPQVTIPFTENPQVIGINFGMGSNPLDPSDDRTGLEGITQFVDDFSIQSLNADGNKAGTLDNVTITEDGVLTGFFNNGTTRPLYRLIVSRFTNEDGLQRLGKNSFISTTLSGKALDGLANEGGAGAVRARSLEKSNVDLSREFVSMIETQRAYQASAKTITTSDEMLNELVALKR